MSRYRGPKIKILKRLGKLPNFTQKISQSLIEYNKKNKNKSNKTEEIKYVTRLKEKQKLKFNYGIVENQLYKYIREARRRNGVTGLILLQLLEMRLDNICFRLGFGKTIAQTRQIVNHGHIIVNQNVVDIPSFQCHLNDEISVKQNSRPLIQKNINIKKIKEIPIHIEFDNSTLKGVIIDYCNRKSVLLKLNELLVVEYYSRR